MQNFLLGTKFVPCEVSGLAAVGVHIQRLQYPLIKDVLQIIVGSPTIVEGIFLY